MVNRAGLLIETAHVLARHARDAFTFDAGEAVTAALQVQRRADLRRIVLTHQVHRAIPSRAVDLDTTVDEMLKQMHG